MLKLFEENKKDPPPQKTNKCQHSWWWGRRASTVNEQPRLTRVAIFPTLHIPLAHENTSIWAARHQNRSHWGQSQNEIQWAWVHFGNGTAVDSFQAWFTKSLSRDSPESDCHEESTNHAKKWIFLGAKVIINVEHLYIKSWSYLCTLTRSTKSIPKPTRDGCG